MKRPTSINTTDDGEIPVIRWANRRKMAWYALISIIVGTSLYWFALPLWFTYFSISLIWIPAVSESYTWFVSLMAIVVVTYLGFKGDLPFLDRLGRFGLGKKRQQKEPEPEPEEEEEEYYDASKH